MTQPPVLDGYERLFRREFAVSTAIGGFHGLAALQAHGPFAVVISDMRMPEMNGVEFLAQVRRRAPDSVRMLPTGHADFDAAIDAVNRGNIYRFLTKPCAKSILVEAIQSGLAQYRAAFEQRELAKRAQVIDQAKSDWDASERNEESHFVATAGLPGPEQARTCLQEYIGADRQRYVLMVKLTMLHTVEERYGEKAAAGYLMSAVQFLTQGPHEEDQLFQWSSNALMAIVRRHISFAAVRMEFSRLLLNSPHYFVEQGGSKAMLTIATSFDLLPLAQYSTIDELMRGFRTNSAEVA